MINTYRCIHCTLMRCTQEGQSCEECLSNVRDKPYVASGTETRVSLSDLDVGWIILTDTGIAIRGNS